MFARVFCALLWIFPIIFHTGKCSAEFSLPYLALYSPGDPEYTDVIVRRVGDNLTLACELKGDSLPRIYFWNYMPSDNSTDGERPYKPETRGPTLGSRLTKPDLQLSDSGHYVCSVPPWSASRYILVQNKSNCARGALWCERCVLGVYVCDGYSDCPHAEDEAPGLCAPHVCSRPDKLNCSSGRCISEAACCRAPAALCRQPACCDEHPRYSRLEAGWAEEYPPLFEDRHAPDEYGFIQSTIYTVTACALIFMIAVVLLVSAICKMHMKRAALRSYTQRPARLTPLSQINARQMHHFPPCYEASRLLEAERNANASTGAVSPPASPARDADQWRAECGEEADGSTSGFGLARLSSLFTSRYRQVATECLDVELRTVRPASACSPTRAPLHYRSPTGDHTDLFLHPDSSECGPDLNYLATPLQLVRTTPRPLTLQLGRFQLSIPRLGRARSDRRPDTPNVAEISIDDLDFVRLNSNETYTLNGRTIRLLGADFENYPGLDTTTRPPPYTEAMRYKLYGPPPEYLSRDALNTERDSTTMTEEQARQNIEMPPCYDELAANNDNNGNNVITVIAITETSNDTQSNALNNNLNSIDDSDANANDVRGVSNASDVCGVSNASDVRSVTSVIDANDVTSVNNANDVTSVLNATACLSAVIDDLPAIDDVNANGLDSVVTFDNAVATTTTTKNNEC